MLQDTICMVVIHHRMVKDTKYCDIMGWLLSCYEPKGRGFESLLARHVAANPCGSPHFSAQNAASPFGLVSPAGSVGAGRAPLGRSTAPLREKSRSARLLGCKRPRLWYAVLTQGLKAPSSQAAFWGNPSGCFTPGLPFPAGRLPECVLPKAGHSPPGTGPWAENIKERCMETTILTEQKVLLFRRHLQEEERSPATIEKYLREVRQFSRWMAHAPVTKEAVLQWKEHLIRQGYQPSTINGKLTSLDQLFRVLERLRLVT